MKQASRIILALVGIAVSFSGLDWLLFVRSRSYDVLSRLGVAAALLCCLSVLVIAWAVPCASLARRRKWSPRTSYTFGALSFLIPAALLMYLAGPERFAAIMVAPMVFCGVLCRRIAYPELTDEEATAPEPPLSLLMK
jgi:hypothetical protein